jgi:hypothetical protein
MRMIQSKDSTSVRSSYVFSVLGRLLTGGRTDIVTDCDKELVMKDLLLGYCKFFHEGGANLAPADIQYFSKVGLPAADRALMRGAQLSVADESENGHDEHTETGAKRELDDSGETIHGQPRWPPLEEIGGICSRPVSMDDAGRVDLRHDPYCLRKHFTTRWGVLKNQDVSDPPQAGSVVTWNDWEWSCSKDEQYGLWVDLDKPDHLRYGHASQMKLLDLISSQLLLYRITANFGVPPYTEDDSYKCAWSFTLWNSDDPTCNLKIYDHKGWPQADFCGGHKASTEALQLFDWLTGENCPHSCDYTPCGRHA